MTELNFDLKDYTEVRDRLFFRVNRLHENEEVLEDTPYVCYADLALTFHILVAKLEDGKVLSIKITDEIFSNFDVSLDQLQEDAMTNSAKLFPATIKTMYNAMKDILVLLNKDGEELVEAPEDADLLVVTNENISYGAAALFYPEMMEKLGEKLGNFFILPSSVHEMLVIPDNGWFSPSALCEMVADVNRMCVSPDERLTDRAYHYNAQKKLFSPC